MSVQVIILRQIDSSVTHRPHAVKCVGFSLAQGWVMATLQY